MTSETEQTLQKVIDLLHNPAYVEENNRIIITNDLFTSKKISKRDFKKYGLELKTTQLDENLRLCEIIEPEINKLHHANQKLIQAMALL
jgi:hypothetical protein